MTDQPDQRRHDGDEQYGQQPAETGTGTRTGTGMTQQPQFGGSTQQSGTNGQQTAGRQMGGQQTGGQQTNGRRTGGQGTSGHRTGTRSTPQGMRGGGQSVQPTRGMRGGSRSTQPHSFDDHMTDELWIALEDFGELSHVAAWCAAQCASGDPELGVCARVCQDLAEIAALNEMLITRDSMFGPAVAETFMRVAEEGLRTLRRYEQRHPHVLETAATIERTMNSCDHLLRQVGGARSDGRQSGRGPGGRPIGGAESTGRRY